MAVIHIPFTQGQSEAVDPKLLPQGLFSSAVNVRYTKDGRLASRFGFALNSSFSGSVSQGGMIGAGNFGPKRSVYVTDRISTSIPARVWDRQDDGNYQQITVAGSQAFGVGTLGVPTRKAVGRNLRYGCVASDVAYISDVIFTAYQDFDTGTAASRGLFLVIADALTGAPFVNYLIDANGTHPRLISCGTVVYLVYTVVGSNNIVFIKYDNTGNALASGTIVAATAGRAYTFDACPFDSNQFGFVYESAANTLNFGTVNVTTGVFTSKGTVATANPSRPSIAIAPASPFNIGIVWNEGATDTTGNTAYVEFTFGGIVVTAKTALYSGGQAVGFPVAGQNTTDRFTFAWNFRPNGALTAISMSTFTPVIGTAQTIGWCAAVSKPFTGPTNGCYLWVANYSSTDDTDKFATYKLIDAESLQQRVEGATCEIVCAQKQAMPGGYLFASNMFENRRHTVTVSTSALAPSTTAFVTVLPTITGSSATSLSGLIQRFGCDLIRVESSTWSDRLLPANINGQLFFSGPRVWEFDGSSFYESGLGDGPEYFTLADAGAGAMGAGTYLYCLVFEWVDAAGRRHQSAPSVSKSITIAASHNVTVSYGGPAFSARFSATKPGVVVSVYRTLAGGSVFFLVNSSTNNVVTTATYDNTIFTYTDSAVDATVSLNEKLYTQGDRGGLSGRLENNEPPPCKYIWAGNNRLILGGLETPSEVQWSKLVFPGEPLAFSGNAAFKARIDGEVTGVSCLDGTWYVGSRNSIFSFSGAGPDDKGAGGDFGDPVKLPADIGFYSQRSMVETPDGLFFQGRADRIYLLPRGGSAPEWIGQEVRDTLSSYPFIVDAQLVPDENLVYFACMNTAATDWRLLVYDTRIKQWYVHYLFQGIGLLGSVLCLDIYDGKLVVNGKWSETSAWNDDVFGAPGKRVTSSMAPTIVLRDGRPRWALGLPGGVRIFTSVFQALVNLIDHRMSLQEAVEAPRIWSQGQELEVEQDVPAAVRDGLAARGHRIVAVGGVAGGMNAVQLNGDGTLEGAACWRADGTPIGVSGGLARPGSRFRPDANRRAT